MYKMFGYPKNNGLIAGSFLLRRHNNLVLRKVSEEWYMHVLRFSKRDQISFNFVSWMHNLNIRYLAGSLKENDLMLWEKMPVRIPGNFRKEVYEWLGRKKPATEQKARRDFFEEVASGRSPRCNLHNWELCHMANKYKSDKGQMYYNAHGYCFVYDELLRSRRNDSVRLLELGLLRHDVQDVVEGEVYGEAPSLSMWAEYFPRGQIFGVDIRDFTAFNEDDRVRVFRFDVSSREELRAFVQKVGGVFDVIIDDASHASHHQQIALDELFTALAPGGYYFIEDLHSQPPRLELPDSVPTRKVLSALKNGRRVETPYLSDATQTELLKQSVSIKFWDSRETAFGKTRRDAICAIRKEAL